LYCDNTQAAYNIHGGLQGCDSADKDAAKWLDQTAMKALARSFVLCGQEPSLLWTPARKPPIGPVCMPMERGRKLVGVCGVCMTCGGGRLSRHVHSLSGIYYSAPSRHDKKLALNLLTMGAAHVTLYRTWRPSVLLTGPHGQVNESTHNMNKVP